MLIKLMPASSNATIELDARVFFQIKFLIVRDGSLAKTRTAAVLALLPSREINVLI